MKIESEWKKEKKYKEVFHFKQTLEVIDRVIGWNTHVLKTDAISECEPFCMTMPLNQEYINRCEYEVLAKTIHEVKMEKVKN